MPEGHDAGVAGEDVEADGEDEANEGLGRDTLYAWRSEAIDGDDEDQQRDNYRQDGKQPLNNPH
ncbi:hypothetical protein [Mesorhizobium sp. M3A.F.Ca.ET.080.04.2.1]|uniref:hypothetical protein n=1 Tax=Mesorhizobium sp. M3A.F.Ca.ET.080.04.2.1 TaxID=2493676 RepID=UPI001FE1C4B5|nr:hypothetical protein [Mesorhizobium sp. M3A.F.Ca.ET.080.04.2.1]